MISALDSKESIPRAHRRLPRPPPHRHRRNERRAARARRGAARLRARGRAEAPPPGVPPRRAVRAHVRPRGRRLRAPLAPGDREAVRLLLARRAAGDGPRVHRRPLARPRPRPPQAAGAHPRRQGGALSHVAGLRRAGHRARRQGPGDPGVRAGHPPRREPANILFRGTATRSSPTSASPRSPASRATPRPATSRAPTGTCRPSRCAARRSPRAPTSTPRA